VPSSVAVL